MTTKKPKPFNPNDLRNIYREFSCEDLDRMLGEIVTELKFRSTNNLASVLGADSAQLKFYRMKLLTWRKIFAGLRDIMDEKGWDHIKVSNKGSFFDPIRSKEVLLRIYNPKESKPKYQLKINDEEQELKALIDEDKY